VSLTLSETPPQKSREKRIAHFIGKGNPSGPVEAGGIEVAGRAGREAQEWKSAEEFPQRLVTVPLHVLAYPCTKQRPKPKQ
jgi:hypothetical protein